MTLKVGDRLPDFSGKDENGNIINISDYTGKYNIVIYSYPKDNSLGCTKEACIFRDEIDNFKNLNAVVIGLNKADAEEHKKFIDKNRLPFHIIADKDKSIHKMLDIKAGLIPERVTYVVDKKGIIRTVFNSQTRYDEHPKIAKKALEEIEKEEKMTEKS